MLADPAGLLRKMWHADPWKQRRKGEPACWERQREVSYAARLVSALCVWMNLLMAITL